MKLRIPGRHVRVRLKALESVEEAEPLEALERLEANGGVRGQERASAVLSGYEP
jgi:hypothetical protein